MGARVAVRDQLTKISSMSNLTRYLAQEINQKKEALNANPNLQNNSLRKLPKQG